MLKWTKHHQPLLDKKTGQSDNHDNDQIVDTTSSNSDILADSVDSNTDTLVDSANSNSNAFAGGVEAHISEESTAYKGDRSREFVRREGNTTEEKENFYTFVGNRNVLHNQDPTSLSHTNHQHQTSFADSSSAGQANTETTGADQTLTSSSPLLSQPKVSESFSTSQTSESRNHQETSQVCLPTSSELQSSFNTSSFRETGETLPTHSFISGSADNIRFENKPNICPKDKITLPTNTSSLQPSVSIPLFLSPNQRPSCSMAAALPDVTNLASDSEKEILGPEIEWEEEGLDVSQIIDKDSFPCVCLFEERAREKDGQWEHLSPGLKIYSRQPVLIHMHVKKRQARARTVYKNPRGAYYEVGQTMLIPDDYKGWFELVPSDFSRPKCFMSIAEVANAMPRKFFTRSNVKGIRIEGEGENQKYLERKVVAGSVLETRGTFTAKWKTSAETGTFKKKTKEWEFQEVTYLKCVDRDQAELLVPLSHKGKFNAIYERGQMTQMAVYSMKDILTDLGLPIRVRLLFGKAPVVPCIFTGMLSIREACKDDVILGSTLLNKRNVLFEIPTPTPVKMKYLSHDEPFREMDTYKDAQKLCKKHAHMFSTMIKLSPDLDTDQKVIQHMPTTPSIMKETEEALQALDLITDISLISEPKDHLLDSDSAASEEQVVVPKGGALSELTEFKYKTRESITFV